MQCFEAYFEARLKGEAVGLVDAVVLPVGGAFYLPRRPRLIVVYVEDRVPQPARQTAATGTDPYCIAITCRAGTLSDWRLSSEQAAKMGTGPSAVGEDGSPPGGTGCLLPG